MKKWIVIIRLENSSYIKRKIFIVNANYKGEAEVMAEKRLSYEDQVNNSYVIVSKEFKETEATEIYSFSLTPDANMEIR